MAQNYDSSTLSSWITIRRYRAPLLQFCRKTFRAAQRPRDEKQSLGRGTGGEEKGQKRGRETQNGEFRERKREKGEKERGKRERERKRERDERSKSEYVFKNTPLDQNGLLSSW